MAVESDTDSDDIDLDDAFDSVDNVEASFIVDGAKMGQQLTIDKAYKDGYDTAFVESSKLGYELGFIHSFVLCVQLSMANDDKSVHRNITKIVDRLANRLTLVQSQLDKESLSTMKSEQSLQTNVDTIRAQFQLLLQRMNVLQSLLKRHKSEKQYLPPYLLNSVDTTDNEMF